MSQSELDTTIASSSTLLPELLGFQPQFVLDDLFNCAQDSVILTINAMQDFLDRWASERVARLRAAAASNSQAQNHPDTAPDGWDGAEEIEQGLVALQTLLDSHVDRAFDFFEIWSLRNIYQLPAGAPVVLPHHRGLDLDRREKGDREAELLAEIEDLRRKTENTYRAQTLYKHAAAASRAQLAASKARLQQLSFLSAPSAPLPTLAALPEKLDELRAALAAMPDVEEIHDAGGHEERAQAADLRRTYGRRPWEDRDGYEAWALARAARGEGLDTEDVPPVEAEGMDRLLAAREDGMAGGARAFVEAEDDGDNA